jgi:hypothetical protein
VEDDIITGVRALEATNPQIHLRLASSGTPRA